MKKAKGAERLISRRAPGLDGTYSGTCIACLRPTDTGLGVRGEPEWHAAFLTILGVPTDEAIATVQAFHNEPGPDGRYDGVYRVCTRCAAKATKAGKPLPVPVLAVMGAGLPVIEQM